MNATAVQADGKVITVGRSERKSSGENDFAIVRLNSDGSLDTSCGEDGKAIIAFDHGRRVDEATGGKIQPDGMNVVVVDRAESSTQVDFDFAAMHLAATTTILNPPPVDTAPPILVSAR